MVKQLWNFSCCRQCNFNCVKLKVILLWWNMLWLDCDWFLEIKLYLTAGSTSCLQFSHLFTARWKKPNQRTWRKILKAQERPTTTTLLTSVPSLRNNNMGLQYSQVVTHWGRANVYIFYTFYIFSTFSPY